MMPIAAINNVANSPQQFTDNLSREILELASQIGKLEEIIKEKGFPRAPVALKVDKTEIVLDDFKHREREVHLTWLQVADVCKHLGSLSADCSLVPNDEIRKVFERQINILLYEKWAPLDGSLRSFQRLLKGHLALCSAQSCLNDIKEEIFQKGPQIVDKRDLVEIREQVKNLALEVKVVPPFLKMNGAEFCNLHWEKKKTLFDIIMLLETKLNMEENKEREVVRGAVEKLSINFQKLCKFVENPVAQIKIKKEIYTALQALPLKFLEEIFTQVSIPFPAQRAALTDIECFVMQTSPDFVEQALENALLKYPSYRPLSLPIVQRQMQEDPNVDKNESGNLEFSKRIGVSIIDAASEIVNVDAEEKQETVITVKCKDVPNGQKIFIRGNGPGLNWEKGVPMAQIDWESWELRIVNAKKEFEYKLLMNDEDSKWEQGANHKIVPGKKEVIQPSFSSSILPPLQKTVIEVVYRIAQGKGLFISGNGPLGNWDKKIPLNYLGNDRWYLSLEGQCCNFEYKFRLDEAWEPGSNYTAEPGKRYHFPSLTFGEKFKT